MVTRCPEPRRTRCGTNVRATRNGPVRLTEIVRAKSSGVVSATGVMKQRRALLTLGPGKQRAAGVRGAVRASRKGSGDSEGRSVGRVGEAAAQALRQSPT